LQKVAWKRPKSREQYDQTSKVSPPKIKTNNLEKARLRFQEGKVAFKKGIYSDAVDLFGQAAYLDSSVADYHFYLSLAYGKQKNFQDAQKEIIKAIKLDPFNADYISELGYIYLGLGFNLRATTAFEKAIKLDPSNKKAVEALQKIKNSS
jgi:tetratricopeptide (TPR) repeat protein